MTDVTLSLEAVIATVTEIAAAGLDFEDATQIVRSAQQTILLISYPGGNNVGLKLPADGQIGDVIEFHNVTSQPFGCYPATGETINGNDFNSPLGIPAYPAVKQIRKITSTNWSVII